MDKYLLKTVAVAGAVLMLAACSSAPPPAATTEAPATTAPAKPAGPVSGKTAFYAMYKPARTWAADVEALSLSSGELPGFKNEDGKAALWTAVFASPSLHQARHLLLTRRGGEQMQMIGHQDEGVQRDAPLARRVSEATQQHREIGVVESEATPARAALQHVLRRAGDKKPRETGHDGSG